MSAIPNLSIDHFGINVVDLDRMIDIYSRVMGFSLNDRGETATGIEMAFLSRSPEKHHQIVLAAGRSADTPSQINQISFRVDSLADLRRLNEMLEGEDEISELFVTTHGVSWSVYFKDPEGNRTEFFVETPWYTPAPRGMKLDLTRSDEEIYRTTEEALKQQPEFMTRADWGKQAAMRMQQAES
jgi:catechol-2,3-dioxygenase